ncbi:MFS transporter [Breoghania sp. JC706]|uniref:MFS transporter n=1 Tax=Breoghania sp. JC706 TaxID=3117732 RepID=UPI0030089997
MTDEASTLSGGVPEKRAVDTKSNFGFWGWSIVIIEAFMLWGSAGVQVHGLNIMVPTLSEHFGIPRTTLLFWATPASWGSVIAGFVCAMIADKFGAKITIVMSLIMCALCFGMLGTWGTVPGFVILFFGVCFFGSGYAYVGGFALIANWFPGKKNLALGWVTMGQTFSTVVFVPLLAFLFANIGVQAGFWAISALLGVQLVIVLAMVKNTPEERGMTPDNMPVVAPASDGGSGVAESKACPFTMGQLLKMKDVWFIALGSGGIFVMLVGVLSQFVPRLMTLGYSLDKAILYLSVSALIGVPGAYMWGWIGQKFGTKNGLLFYTLWWLVAVILNMFELSPVVLYLSLGMLGLSFGGASNLTTAIVAEKFPRAAFVRAFALIQPIQGILRCCSFAILAFGLTYLGGYIGAYACLAAVGVVTLVLFWIMDPTPVA